MFLSQETILIFAIFVISTGNHVFYPIFNYGFVGTWKKNMQNQFLIKISNKILSNYENWVSQKFFETWKILF